MKSRRNFQKGTSVFAYALRRRAPSPRVRTVMTQPTRKVAAAIVAFTIGVASAPGCKKPEPPPAAKPIVAARHVETRVVEEQRAPKELVVSGVLDADQRTDLAANATGRVVRTFVERGQRVAAGALLAQLDTRTASLSRAEANANAKGASEQLASVRTECARSEELLRKGAISQAEFDRSSAQCRTQSASDEAAQARAAMAAQNISDASIRAPFAGVIAERFAKVGDYVRPDSKIVTLLVDNPLRLRLTIPEPFIGFAKEGTTVTFETVSVPGRVFSGVIKYVGREVRSTTRDVVDEAVIDNRDGALLPGMFVIARIPSGDALLPIVPKGSIVDVDGTTSAFVVVDSRIQQRIVQPGARLGDNVAILDGLKKGDRVVLDPSHVNNGELVD